MLTTTTARRPSPTRPSLFLLHLRQRPSNRHGLCHPLHPHAFGRCCCLWCLPIPSGPEGCCSVVNSVLDTRSNWSTGLNVHVKSKVKRVEKAVKAHLMHIHHSLIDLESFQALDCLDWVWHYKIFCADVGGRAVES